MNVFLIPSWYPSRAEPVAGVFTREQAEAIADLAPDMRVLISTWGHQDGAVQPRRPWTLMSALAWRLRQQPDQVRPFGRAWEIFNPALTWSHRLPLGGAKRLLDVNRRNFLLAERRFGPIDIIHAHVSYPAGWVAAALAVEFCRPYVLTEHMSPFPFVSLLKDGKPLPEVAVAIERAGNVIAVSPALADQVESYGYSRPLVIPNMVDERRFSIPAASRQIDGKVVFFTLGGITHQKGIDVLLEAISLWNPSAEKFEFRIGGDGEMKSAYQALAEKLGIADRVRWLGQLSREEAPESFRDCDIFVLPSRHESFGVVYAEALACGKPVIASRCGGPEFIVNENNGRLVDVENVRQLADAMLWMARHRQEFSAGVIRQDFEGRFSRAAVVGQITALYRALV